MCGSEKRKIPFFFLDGRRRQEVHEIAKTPGGRSKPEGERRRGTRVLRSAIVLATCPEMKIVREDHSLKRLSVYLYPLSKRGVALHTRYQYRTLKAFMTLAVSVRRERRKRTHL